MNISKYTINLNRKDVLIEAEADMPLLWVIRDLVGLTGTKYGCGVGQCGACTVHLDGRSVRSCQIPISSVKHQKVTTIEGIATDKSHPVISAWVEEQVPQCGFCQSGQIMGATSLLQQIPKPTDEQIETAMTPYICRCGAYQKIKSAIKRAAQMTS